MKRTPVHSFLIFSVLIELIFNATKSEDNFKEKWLWICQLAQLLLESADTKIIHIK